MEEFINDWKKITTNSIAEHGAFIHNKNNAIMDSIINYEKKEIKSKQGVKAAIIFVVLFFLMMTPLQIQIGTTELRTIHIIGYALMFFGLFFSYLNNRTDNFPDARVLPTVSYLEKVRDNIRARRKKHVFNSIILFLFYIPGMFCCFHNYFIRGDLAPILNQAVPFFLAFLSVLMIKGAYDANKKYYDETEGLNSEIEKMITEVQG